jgi:hypothetical protein
MKRHTPSFTRGKARAFSSGLLAYVLLVGQLTPLALASNGRTARVAPAGTSDVARRESAGAAATSARAFGVTAAPAAPGALAPAITATKTDSFADPDMDGRVAPGGTITYSVTVTNNGTSDATNVTLTDTVDPNTTIVGGSAVSTPVAFDDTFNVVGNVRIQPGAAQGLLANDSNPNTGNNTGLTASGPTASTQGGEVAINADGSFSYNPPAGFTGTDTFTYTITDAGGRTDTGTVTLNVGNGTATPGASVIWFVNDDAPAGGDGRLTSPFNCLAGAGASCFSTTAADQDGDNIFLFEGTYADTAALTLLNAQRLIGQAATDTLQTITGVTVPAYSDALPQTNEPSGNNFASPTITSTANGVVLAQNNTLRGFTVGNVPAASYKIGGTGFGQLAVGKTTEPDVSLGGTGRALQLVSGTFAAGSGLGAVVTTSGSGAASILLSQITAGALTFASTTVSGASLGGVEVNASSADINFGATDISAGTDGVTLANNAAGTRTFSSLTITGGSGIGFRHFDPDGIGSAVGGGAVSVTGATTVTNPTGNGIDVQNSNANLSFAATTVGKNNAGTGINIVNNPTRTITFSSLAVTTANGTGLNATNSSLVGTIINVTNATGSFINATGTGSTAAPAINAFAIVFGANFTTLTASGGGSGSGTGISLGNISGSLTVNNGTNTATNIQNTGGIGINVSLSDATINFGNTIVNGTGAKGVDIGGNVAPGSIAFGDLDINPDAGQIAFNATSNTTMLSSSSGDIATTGAPAISISGPAGRTPLAMVLNNVDSTNSTTQGLLLNLVSGNFTVNDSTLATNIQNSTNNGIEVTNTGAGAVNFGNTTVNASGNANGDDAGTGVVLTNNAGAITFGALTVTPDSGERGLYATDTDATAAGAITVASGTITTTNDTAVEIAGQASGNRTPINIQLTTVNTTGGAVAANGIALSNTSAAGNPGGFRVLGNGGSCTSANPGICTGGRITNTTGSDDSTPENNGGIGVRLFNADKVFLTRMRIDNHTSFAVHGTGVAGFNLDTSVLDGTNGNNATFEEGVIGLRELTGTSAAGTTSNITNSFISGGREFMLDVRNFNGGTLNRLTVQNNTFGAFQAGTDADDAVHFEGFGSGATFNVTFSNNVVQQARGDMVNFNVGVTGNNPINSDLVMRGNTLHNTHGTILSGGGGSTITMGGGATVNSTYDISCNSIRGAKGFGLLVAKTLGSGTAQGTIFNNRIGVDGVAGSASTEASGLDVDTRGAGTHTVLIKNNQVHEWGANGAYQIFNNQGSATMNVTVQGNLSNNPHATNALAGFYAEVGALSGDTSVLNLLVGGAGANENNFVEGDPFNGNDVLLSRIAGAGTTLNLSRGVSAASTVQQIITDNNVDPVTAAGAGTINFVNTQPTLPPNVDQSCSAPTAPSTVIVEGSETAGAAPAETTVNVGATQETATESNNNVTSRAFVSPSRTVQPQAAGVALRQAAADVTAPAQPGTNERTAEVAARAETPTPLPPTVNGDTLTFTIGTLPAGASVTVTFQVVVDDPFTGSQPQVSNQGTVTADGGVSVLTDDPDAAGAANPTVTLVTVPPDVSVRDAKVAEPASGTAQMLFTVALSAPASGTVSVDYQTADGGATPATGGADCSTPGVDYLSENGTVTFSAGEQVKTISVDICADAVDDDNETLLVNLSNPSGAALADAQATGTITANTPGAALISELRTSGPAGPADEYVEVYNNTDSPVTVQATDSSGGWGLFKAGASCAATPVLVGTIPDGTVIPARGHYLFVGAAYSLANYGGTGAAAGNLTLSSDIEADRNVGLFTTSDVAQVSSANTLDAVGFFDGVTGVGDNCDLLREGTPLNAAQDSASEYSFFRKLTTGRPQDTGRSVDDFQLVSTTPGVPVGFNNTPALGAPGPENLASPVQRTSQMQSGLIAPCVASTQSPNRVRNTTPYTDSLSNTGSYPSGTLSIRRTFTNNTGAPVTRLRYRVVDITAFPVPAGTADLRAVSSPDITVVNPCGGPTAIKGTTLEQPPAQAEGGGLNSTLASGTITTMAPLASGGKIDVQFLLGGKQSGGFRFFIIVEVLP